MLPDRVSNPGPLTYKSGALPIALCGLAALMEHEEVYTRDKTAEFANSVDLDEVRWLIMSHLI